MKRVEFTKAQVCPLCGTRFAAADQESRYEPVVVFNCPGCSRMLWRPGLDADGSVFAFDPDADEGGI